jgi:hypothetical protein
MPTALITATTFTMDFDFNPASQTQVLQDLQNGGFTLLAYKGAKGPSQVTTGLPTWFSVPFIDIFGAVEISYTPRYKVYVFNQATIAANTVIDMESLSVEIDLGTALNFLPDGSFTTAGSANEGTITLNDLRPAGTPDVTVGLAGRVTVPAGPQFLPFCAFTLSPQGSINMEPIETVALMAARLNLQSGNVQANASAPGCSFTFDSEDIDYKLMVEPSTFAVTNQPGASPVTALTSGTALTFLNS